MNVIELFAGVGGFRVGLEKASPLYKFVWANQWEPGTKTQHAWQIYEANFGLGSCVNQDITTIDCTTIPQHDLLTAGFPCQDYSVAKSLKYSGGLEGKKGVLWWEIVRIIKEKNPTYLLLENVDRLLSSPSKQKGRDFAIILKTLQENNYVVEWRIVNAADYGFPQKRKRTFIFAALNSTPYSRELLQCPLQGSLINRALKIEEVAPKSIKTHSFTGNVLDISNNFGLGLKRTFFENAGVLTDQIYTYHAKPLHNEVKSFLRHIIVDHTEVPEDYWITDIKSWEPFKLGRRIERIDKKTGFKYIYAEGKMSFPDSLDKPMRTIITGEGGKAPSRFKHLISHEGRYRRLIPLELERANMFPDNHTKGVSDIKRAFLMGNALVTGVVTAIGQEIIKLYDTKNF